MSVFPTARLGGGGEDLEVNNMGGLCCTESSSATGVTINGVKLSNSSNRASINPNKPLCR